MLFYMTKLASSAPSLNSRASEIGNLEVTQGPVRTNFGPDVFQ